MKYYAQSCLKFEVIFKCNETAIKNPSPCSNHENHVLLEQVTVSLNLKILKKKKKKRGPDLCAHGVICKSSDPIAVPVLLVVCGNDVLAVHFPKIGNLV